MDSGRHVGADGYFAREFFMNLSGQCGARILACLNLPAGELPHTRQGSIRASLGSENRALTHDERTDDVDRSPRWLGRIRGHKSIFASPVGRC